VTKHEWLRAVMCAQLAAGAAKVAWCLADHANANAVAWPLVARIAEAVNLDEKNVRTHLHALQDAGWIVIEDRRHLRRGSWYWLTQLVDGEPKPLGDYDSPPLRGEPRGVVRGRTTGQQRPLETVDFADSQIEQVGSSRPGSSARSNGSGTTGQQCPVDDRAAAPARTPVSTGQNGTVRPGEITPDDRAAAPGRSVSVLSPDRSEKPQVTRAHTHAHEHAPTHTGARTSAQASAREARIRRGAGMAAEVDRDLLGWLADEWGARVKRGIGATWLSPEQRDEVVRGSPIGPLRSTATALETLTVWGSAQANARDALSSVLDGAFSDPFMAERKFPIALVAAEPSKYLGKRDPARRPEPEDASAFRARPLNLRRSP
jgi:hypothetical protein